MKKSSGLVMSKARNITPFPFRVYFFTILFIVLVGLFDSIYLAVSHYRVYTDIGYRSFCAISKAINCDTVSQSAFSIFLGIPVSVWGIIGYTFFLTVMIFAWRKYDGAYRLWAFLFIIALGFSAYSVILAFISTYYIRSYCIMCLLSYAVNLTLAYYTWLIRKRFNHENIKSGTLNDVKLMLKYRHISGVIVLCFSIFIFIGMNNFPKYWILEPPAKSVEITTGVTKEGYPWIGAENPELTITEFTDYLCFQCKKMHFYLRRMIAQNPTKLRVVHRHFPMDHEFNPVVVPEPFHVGAGKLAILANYALTKNRFWEMNDYLYNLDISKGAIDLKQIAEKLELKPAELSEALKKSVYYEKLAKDIADGIQYGVSATPSYVIDAKLHTGIIPPEILKKVIK